MNFEHQQEIIKAVRETIKETVNGKIDRMDKKIDEYIIKDNEYKASTDEWRKSVTPSIEIMKSMESFSKGTMFVFKFIIAMGAVTGVIYGLTQWLRK
jgi:hypothetical protein